MHSALTHAYPVCHFWKSKSCTNMYKRFDSQNDGNGTHALFGGLCIRGLKKTLDPLAYSGNATRYTEVKRTFLCIRLYRPMICLLLASGMALLESVTSYARGHQRINKQFKAT